MPQSYKSYGIIRDNIEDFIVTHLLRWKNGILEQMHQGTLGNQKWESVPNIGNETIILEDKEETYKIEKIARILFIRHYTNREDSSLEWAEKYWDENSNAEHKGNCPIVKLKGPITCDRCACEEFKDDAKAVLSVLTGKNNEK